MSVAALEPTAVARPALPVALQLARREGRRMLRHPFMWVGGVLSLALFGLFTWHSAPVLHRDDSFAAGALLPLAITTLVVANLAASRGARDSTEELYGTTSTPETTRTLGHLLSLAYAVALGIGLVGVMAVYELLDSPVGTPNAAEVASGFLSVILFGAAGIAIGRWKPHPALGPLAVVVAVALEILLIQSVVDIDATSTTVVSRRPWLAPWVPLGITGEVPAELVVRPAGWHVLYLAGAAVLFAALALARSGRRTRLVPLFLAGAAAVAFGAVGQLTPASATQRAERGALLEHPEDHQVCDERRGVTYCAYPAYAPWIDRWAEAVEGAMDRIPPEARPAGVVVRQRFGSYFEGPIDVPPKTLRAAQRAPRRAPSDGTIWTGDDWGRGRTEGGYALGLGLAVAMEALDFPSSRAEMRPTPDEAARFAEGVLPVIDPRFRERAEKTLRHQNRLSSCTTMHQARAMAALWIAAQATPATRAAVIRSAEENPYGLTTYENDGRRIATYIGPFLPIYPEIPPPMWDRITMSAGEFHYAVELLDRPEEEVADAFADHWDALTDPATTTESLLDELGLTPHPTIADQIADLPEDVHPERRRGMWHPDAFFAQSLPCF